MKYIIRNCPSCRQYQVGIYTCDDLYDCDLQRCQDCTDCVLKQIVDLCKRTCRMRCTNDCLGTKKHCGYGQILKLLDIQEVE